MLDKVLQNGPEILLVGPEQAKQRGRLLGTGILQIPEDFIECALILLQIFDNHFLLLVLKVCG
jgi:hypothetical protein